MIIKSANLLSPNKTSRVLSGMLPAFELNSKHSLSVFCLRGMTCLSKAPLWIPPDTALQQGLPWGAGPLAKQAAFWVRPSGMEFSAGPCKAAAGPKTNRIYSIFTFIHSPRYTGLSLIKRKDAVKKMKIKCFKG